MSEYDSTADTLDHINKVQVRIAEVQAALDTRAAVHDRSKLEAPEKAGFDAAPPIFSMEYLSDEYEAGRRMLAGALAHHYAHNTHHPEHWPDGIAGMSLLDILEMFCDWKAGSERVRAGSMADSLVKNRARFGISDQLFAILENTARELGW